MRRLRRPRARVAEVQLLDGVWVERGGTAGWRREIGAEGRRCVMRRGAMHLILRRSASAVPRARGSAELVCAGVHETEMELLRFTWSRKTFTIREICLLATALMARVANYFTQ